MIAAIQTYNPITLISAPKIHTNLLWDLSFLFVGLAILYFIFVFFYRNRLSANATKEKQRKRELSPMISEFLFYEAKSTKEENTNYVNLKIEIRQLLKDDFNRRILSEILLDLRKDVAGETQKRVFKLYQDLGLANDAFEKLKSKRWQIVSKAILELTQMQVTEAYSFVTKFINDKRTTIRRQAEIAVVTLKPEGINYFLDTTKYKISEWQQLKILDVLRMEEDFLPPPFKAWLTSSNRHVVLFALRLLKYYNQNDAEAALIELVKHKNNQIKEEAIACIKEFHFTSALETLKLVFWKCSIDVKIAILDAIACLGSDSDIEFLKLIEKKEANFSVKSKAHSSINAIIPDSIMPSKGVLDLTNYNVPADLTVKLVELEDEEQVSNEVLEQTQDTSSFVQTEPELDDTIIPEKTTMKNPESTDKSKYELDDSLKSEQLSHEFLPIVVQEDAKVFSSEISNEINKIEVNIPSDQSTLKETVAKDESQDPIKDLFSIEVRAEELAFLPIVTDNTEEVSINSNRKESKETEISFHDIEVIIEEDEHLNSDEIEVEMSDTYSEFHRQEILEIQVNSDEIILNDSENDQPNIEIENSPLLEFGNEFIDINNVDEDIEVSKITSEIEIEENKVEKISNSEELTIPNAIIGDETHDEIIPCNDSTEESRIQLLNNITDMGDEREIPFLEELLVNTEFDTVKDRIKKLIATFSDSEESLAPEVLFKPFNVFEDLFRTCDTEAKLILMDEIVAVGDEGEIVFLEGLIAHEEGKVLQKAKEILSMLSAKLSIEKEQFTQNEKIEATDNSNVGVAEVLSERDTLSKYDSLLQELDINQSKEEDDMFDLTFELTDPNASDEDILKNDVSESQHGAQTSILGQICSISNKIIAKLNG